MEDEPIEKAFGECLGRAIGEYRERMKLTQVDLAKKLGKTHGRTVSDIENGKKRITKEDLVRICEKLKVPFLDIVDQAFLIFRKRMIALVGDEGGFLLGPPPVTREEVENGFVSLMSKYLQYAHPPTESESLRYNVRKRSGSGRDEE